MDAGFTFPRVVIMIGRTIPAFGGFCAEAHSWVSFQMAPSSSARRQKGDGGRIVL